MGTAKVISIGGSSPTNGGKDEISFEHPFAIEIEVSGSAPILFHRWNVEAVEEKAKAKKGSKAKKTDNLESYLYRNEDGELCLPGEYVRQAIILAAKYHQDPRSPRKSAMDLFKAGVVSETELAGLGVNEPDYIDRRRVVVQRSGITRERPALRAGWKATIILRVLIPEYISSSFLLEVLSSAGRLVGVGDFRPTYGRFQVVSFNVLADSVAA